LVLLEWGVCFVPDPPFVFAPGFQQEDEGPFWHVRCNRKLKPGILNLLGFFDILTQIILDSVKKMKCGKLNHISEYIKFMY